MRQVYIARDLIEAQSIKNRLDEAGIESVVQGDYLSAAWGALPITPDTSPSIWVVRDDDFDKAVECVEQLKRNPPARPTTGWKCERCGEIIDAQFTECWKCAAEPAAEALATYNAAERDATAASAELNSEPTLDESAPISTVAVAPPVIERTYRDLWMETSVVILVFVVTSLYGNVDSLIWPEDVRTRPSLRYSLSYVVSDLSVIGLVCYLIWRSGELRSAFGLVRPRWLWDLPLGLGFWAMNWVLQCAAWPVLIGLLGQNLFEPLPTDAPWDPPTPHGIIEILVFVVSICVAASTEELVMRAYLIPRFERLVGSTAWSVLVTAALFGIIHIYQGMYWAVSAFITGLVYGMMFSLWRRLWPIAIAHTIGNLIVYWSIFADRA